VANLMNMADEIRNDLGDNATNTPPSNDVRPLGRGQLLTVPSGGAVGLSF